MAKNKGEMLSSDIFSYMDRLQAGVNKETVNELKGIRAGINQLNDNVKPRPRGPGGMEKQKLNEEVLA